MGEEVLHVAITTYATRPMSLYKARQDTSSTGFFFPCWCAIGSFFAAAQQSHFSLQGQVSFIKVIL